MLEHLPAWLGAALRDRRAGHAKLIVADAAIVPADAAGIALSSPAFAAGARLPERFTADGDGVSPPLVWDGPPAGARSLVLIVEDPDAPAPQPLVHAILWGIAPDDNGIAEGSISADGERVGRNSYQQRGWLPPDPPTGHGDHDYVFQLLALSDAPAFEPAAGRTALREAIAGKVVGAGVLIGTYARGAPAAAGVAPAAAPA